MNLVEYERAFVDLLFKKDFAKSLATLCEASDDPNAEKRFRVYRRMARDRLADVVANCFPRVAGALGEGAHGTLFESVIERWFDEAPPRSPYLRDVGAELLAWLRPEVLPANPPWILELARHEQAMLEIEHTHEEEGAEDVREIGELDFHRPAILTPAHRILRARYAVHRLPEEGVTPTTQVEEGPFALCLYRDPASHEVRVLELSPAAAAILEEVRRPNTSVVEAVRNASVREGFAIDADLVAGFSELAFDLAERGVWLGAKPVESCAV